MRLPPGPEPTYPSKAEKQRAYRERNRERLKREREEGQELRELAHQVRDAVHQAALAGDELAKQSDLVEPALTLQALRDHFLRVAGIAPPSQAGPSST